jgi:hypothetical protein
LMRLNMWWRSWHNFMGNQQKRNKADGHPKL